MTITKPTVLIIKREPEKIMQFLEYGLEEKVSLYSATTGLDGLCKSQQLHPYMVIIDVDLPDLNGATVATSIKDNYELKNTLVYLTGIESVLENTKADRFIPYAASYEILIAQIKSDFNCKHFQKISEEWENSIIRQYDCLCPEYSVEESEGSFSVHRILSPYHYLSGDGLFYTLVKGAGLYGFIFDCAGHDLSSYGQAAATLYMLKLNMWQYQAGNFDNLTQVMSAVNNEIINNFIGTTLIPALCFYLDVTAMSFKFCSAGIPSIVLKMRNRPAPKNIPCNSYILGYDNESTWEERSIDLKDVEEIILITDGLNDLLREHSEQQAFAKADDISAIFIKFYHNDK